MCREMEQMRNEASMQKGQEIAIRLAEMGLSLEQISQAVKEPIEIVKSWIENAEV